MMTDALVMINTGSTRNIDMGSDDPRFFHGAAGREPFDLK
jgi:hypothetical protein